MNEAGFQFRRGVIVSRTKVLPRQSLSTGQAGRKIVRMARGRAWEGRLRLGLSGEAPAPRGRAVSASALTGAGAERQGDAPPGVEVRGRGRQVEGDAAHRNDDVGAQLQQPVAQPCHLGAGTPGTRRAQQEFLHQHVGRGGDEHAELIRPEATAARAVDLEAVSEGSAASDGCVRGIRRQRWLRPGPLCRRTDVTLTGLILPCIFLVSSYPAVSVGTDTSLMKRTVAGNSSIFLWSSRPNDSVSVARPVIGARTVAWGATPASARWGQVVIAVRWRSEYDAP